MVWFSCSDCGDSIKKPKLAAHCNGCSASAFTCIDCSQTFDRQSAKFHVTCVTEHEKYALGATKPGGFAANGFQDKGQDASAAGGQVTGTEYLSQGAPWRCSICNVSCTSRETLLSHAQGQKHARKVRGAAKGGESATKINDKATQDDAKAGNKDVPSGSDANGHVDNDTSGKGEKKSKKAKHGEAVSVADTPTANGAEAPDSKGKQKRSKAKDGKECQAAVPAVPASANGPETPGSKKKEKKSKAQDELASQPAAPAELSSTPAPANGAETPGSKKKEKKSKTKDMVESQGAVATEAASTPATANGSETPGSRKKEKKINTNAAVETQAAMPAEAASTPVIANGSEKPGSKGKEKKSKAVVMESGAAVPAGATSTPATANGSETPGSKRKEKKGKAKDVVEGHPAAPAEAASKPATANAAVEQEPGSSDKGEQRQKRKRKDKQKGEDQVGGEPSMPGKEGDEKPDIKGSSGCEGPMAGSTIVEKSADTSQRKNNKKKKLEQRVESTQAQAAASLAAELVEASAAMSEGGAEGEGKTKKKDKKKKREEGTAVEGNSPSDGSEGGAVAKEGSRPNKKLKGKEAVNGKVKDGVNGEAKEGAGGNGNEGANAAEVPAAVWLAAVERFNKKKKLYEPKLKQLVQAHGHVLSPNMMAAVHKRMEAELGAVVVGTTVFVKEKAEKAKKKVTVTEAAS